MTTEQKYVLVIRWQLPNWEKTSRVLLAMTFQGHGKLFQHNIVGKSLLQVMLMQYNMGIRYDV